MSPKHFFNLEQFAKMFQRTRYLLQSLTRHPINKRVLICPNCGSSKIRQADSISGFITPPRYFCQNCYYSGHFIVEVDREEKGLKKYTVKRKGEEIEGAAEPRTALHLFRSQPLI
ncbi:MAG: hypothetical protein QXO71_05650 [Candidatus Jordarchaeaceae archaeon]